jgi:hypothetical protein
VNTAGCLHAVREQRRTTLTSTDCIPFPAHTPASPRCVRIARGLRENRGWHTLESCDECTLKGSKPTGYGAATVGGALAYLLWFRGIERLSPATVSLLTLANPLTATLAGLVVISAFVLWAHFGSGSPVFDAEVSSEAGWEKFRTAYGISYFGDDGQFVRAVQNGYNLFFFTHQYGWRFTRKTARDAVNVPLHVPIVVEFSRAISPASVTEESVRLLCDRRAGIGGDGMAPSGRHVVRVTFSKCRGRSTSTPSRAASRTVMT